MSLSQRIIQRIKSDGCEKEGLCCPFLKLLERQISDTIDFKANLIDFKNRFFINKKIFINLISDLQPIVFIRFSKDSETKIIMIRLDHQIETSYAFIGTYYGSDSKILLPYIFINTVIETDAKVKTDIGWTKDWNIETISIFTPIKENKKDVYFKTYEKDDLIVDNTKETIKTTDNLIEIGLRTLYRFADYKKELKTTIIKIPQQISSITLKSIVPKYNIISVERIKSIYPESVNISNIENLFKKIEK